jgi:hypothetical protein
MSDAVGTLNKWQHLPLVRRVRDWVGIAAVWACCEALLTLLVRPRGLDRPAVLVPGQAAVLAAVLTLVAVWAGAALGSLISGRINPSGALTVTTAGLAFWALARGTIDDWLKLVNVQPGPATSAPYWPLLADWAVLVVALVGAVLIGALMARRGSLAHVLRWSALRAEWQTGLLAVLIGCAATGLILWILSGGSTVPTRRGQVYFAVFVAGYAVPWVLRGTLGKTHPLWAWLVPALMSFVGLVVAGMRPALALSVEYAKQNIIPAWCLVRALPVEFLGVGLLATLWAQGALAVDDSERDRRHDTLL